MTTDPTPPEPQLETTATWQLGGRTVIATPDGITITGGQSMTPADAARLADVLTAAAAWAEGQ